MREPTNFGRLREIPLEVHADLARRALRMREILTIAPGSVLPTSKLATDGIDLWVGDVRIGSAEAVAAGTRTELRVTAIARNAGHGG